MSRIAFNDGWLFNKSWKDGMENADYDDSSFEHVRIPHSVIEIPYNYIDENAYQMISCYRKKFAAAEAWAGKRIFVTVDGAAQVAELYVNGVSEIIHSNGYTSFSADITDELDFGSGNVNIIAVRLNSREDSNIPPFGKVVDYLTYGGIYRGIYLEIEENDHINDVFIKTSGCDTASTERTLKTTVKMRIGSDAVDQNNAGRYEIRQSICDSDGRTIMKYSQEWIPFHMKSEEQTVETSMTVASASLWNTKTPVLYRCITALYLDGNKMDEKSTRFGFREIDFRADGLYLNGERIQIRGLDRHQCYPYVGYAMPERVQREDADILKYELGLNTVRCSHYPQSQGFIDRCDEIGLLVFMEFPGWQHIGDAEWKEQAMQNLDEMILQYRNHPSIFIWGIRINESQDDDEFYMATNKAAHELDPTRPTGGVRNFKKSHLLEDVYTYNDFANNGMGRCISDKNDVTPDMSKGYLITEYNGHMYPTKAFDSESHRTEHVLRHLGVLGEVYARHDIAGSIGWCMFDYNTHKDFGSGDRICYHGVMDMFRNPKTAAYVYASQSDAEPVFEITSTMDIGEYPGGHTDDVYALTNADSVKLYKNDELVKEFFPDRNRFSAMPHPPIIINDFVGCILEHHEKYNHEQSEAIKEVLGAITRYGQDSLPLKYKLKMLRLMTFCHMTLEEGTRLYGQYVANWGGEVTVYRYEAWKDGKLMQQIIREPVMSHQLEIKIGTGAAEEVYKLEDGEAYDAEAVRLRMLDQNGNLMPFYQEPVRLSCSGSISLMGPDIISLKGGMGGTYVKTNGTEGEGKLTVSYENTDREIKFLVSVSKESCSDS